MSDTASESNSRIPQVFGVIERSHLLDKLEQSRQHKLTILSAPPGYGKTTLVAQFAGRLRDPVIWQSLDERQRDVPNLQQQSISILEELIPDLQRLPPQPGYTPSERAALITSQLPTDDGQDYFYILDDVHHLMGSPGAEAWLRSIVALIPSNWHIIMMSRVVPQLPLTEMIARREVLAFGQEMLCFTQDEIAALHELVRGMPMEQALVQQLHAYLEGWPAGTLLALHPLPQDLETAAMDAANSDTLFESLAQMMLDAQPAALRHFLLASSTLSRMTPDLCSRALELDRSAYWLSELIRRNLFVTRTSSGVVYHRLFRAFLQKRLRTQEPSAYEHLHYQLARWYEENDELDLAVDHFLEAEALDESIKIVEQTAHAHYVQGRTETLLDWRLRLSQFTQRLPELCFTVAMIETDRYDYEDALADLHIAQPIFQQRKDMLGVTKTLLQRAMILQRQGFLEDAAALAQHVAEDRASAENIRGRALHIWGLACIYKGDVQQGAALLEQALPIYQQGGYQHSLSVVLQDLEVAYVRLGRMEEASAALQQVIAICREIGSAGELALALNNLGFHYHRMGDYDQAEQTLQEGISIVTRIPNQRTEAYLLWSFGDLQRDRGAFSQALQCYDRALDLAGSGEPVLQCSLLISSSILHRWQGHLSEAIALAEEALELATQSKIGFERVLADATLQIARAQQGDVAPAQARLAESASYFKDQKAQTENVFVLGLQAAAALCRNDEPLAMDFLNDAADLAQQEDSIYGLAAEIYHNRDLNALVMRGNMRYERIQKRVKRLQKASLVGQEVQISDQLSDMPFSLRVITMGHERVERDTRLLTASDWRATASRELFYYLLFVGPATRQRICLEFWPDHSQDKVRSNFHTTLYRTRLALGAETVIYEDNVYRLNPNVDIWCDVFQFERFCQQARVLPPNSIRTEDLWRKAVTLYQGDFLPHLDAEWMMLRRETLGEMYIDALVGLGDCVRLRNSPQEALGIYRKALEIDPLREEIHRHMMRCYDVLGEKDKVRQHYERMVSLFRDELDSPPSEETQVLVRLLTS